MDQLTPQEKRWVERCPRLKRTRDKYGDDDGKTFDMYARLADQAIRRRKKKLIPQEDMNKTSSKNVRQQMSELGAKYLGKGIGTPAQQYAHSRDAARGAGFLGSPEVGQEYRQKSRSLLAGIGKTAMDKELASAVIDRWESGQPVSEMNLYKAAQALDIDPMAALIEARYYTYLDKCLLEKRAMSKGERIVFSAAAGLNDQTMTKTASSFGLSPDELILEALRERGFVPDIEKIANIGDTIHEAVNAYGNSPGAQKAVHYGAKGIRAAGYAGGAMYAGKTLFGGKDKQALAMPPMDPSQGQGGGKQPPPGQGGQDPMAAMQAMQQGGAMPQDPAAQGAGPEQAAGDIMMAPPDPNAMLQQQQSARVKPSPTGPEQVAASPMGNLDELVGQGQQTFGDQAMDNGGVAPQGMPEPAPPPPSPEERVKQVGPNLDDETVARYAEQLQRFEEGFQMQIADPKQMVKFVKELQKVDGKRIDQGIKAMSEQLEQEQAAELGVDSNPTIDGAGGAAMGGGPGTKMAPKPGGPAGTSPQNPQEMGGDPQMSGSQPSAGDTQSENGGQQTLPNGQPQQSSRPPRPQPKAVPQQQQAAEAAVEKVAHAARALARAYFRY